MRTWCVSSGKPRSRARRAVPAASPPPALQPAIMIREGFDGQFVSEDVRRPGTEHHRLRHRRHRRTTCAAPRARGHGCRAVDVGRRPRAVPRGDGHVLGDDDPHDAGPLPDGHLRPPTADQPRCPSEAGPSPRRTKRHPEHAVVRRRRDCADATFASATARFSRGTVVGSAERARGTLASGVALSSPRAPGTAPSAGSGYV